MPDTKEYKIGEKHMEKCIEKLDQLIALKKKKGHKITKMESEEFSSAWSELIQNDNGFSERAEKYFYDGFIFAGAKPFIQWVLSSEDKLSAFNSLFKGRCFGQDTALSFRVIISSFAQLIIADDPDKSLICIIINRIPSSSKNKERKTIGDGHRIILKYFISELDSTSNYPVLSELGVSGLSITSFVAVFDELLKRLDLGSLSNKDRQTVISINLWLHPEARTEDSGTKDGSPNNESENSAQEDSTKSLIRKEQSFIRNNSNPYDQLFSILNDAVTLSANLRNSSKSLERKYSTLQETLNSFENEIKELNSQLESARQRELSLQEQLTDRGTQISCMNTKIRSLEKEIQEMAETIAEKDQEIEHRIQMINALSRDRTKQSDEQMHRLSSRLKVEYRDFRDAQALEMDSELGENMREQLKNVFSILVKSGISLE